MRSLLGAAATAAILMIGGPVADAAIVGTFTAVGESITTPVVFDKTVFNSFADVPGGLQFAVAPGLQGPVRLELIESTANVKVAAAAIGGAFGIAQALPLVITSTETFTQGVHAFAVGAVTAGSSQGAMITRLTLTPVPPSLLLAVAGFGTLGIWNFARRAQPQA